MAILNRKEPYLGNVLQLNYDNPLSDIINICKKTVAGRISMGEWQPWLPGHILVQAKVWKTY